jgi:hypothetical protein
MKISRQTPMPAAQKMINLLNDHETYFFLRHCYLQPLSLKRRVLKAIGLPPLSTKPGDTL